MLGNSWQIAVAVNYRSGQKEQGESRVSYNDTATEYFWMKGYRAIFSIQFSLPVTGMPAVLREKQTPGCTITSIWKERV